MLSTRVLWIPVSLVWLGMAGALAQAPSPNSDDVTDYAKLCYQRLGIKETDVPATLKCSDGGNLPISVDMAVKDDFQASCDKPVWLGSGVPNSQCYGKNTRIQEIPIAGVTGARNKVRGILFCRHKLNQDELPAALRAAPDETNYDDVNMILYNKENGQTCWFQSPEGVTERDPLTFAITAVAKVDGNVPMPHTPAGKPYWKKPSDAAGINCIGCHDNGPWMNSRWLFDGFAQGKKLEDKSGRPYVNEGVGFRDWRKPTFSHVGAYGVTGASCTGCHRIHDAIYQLTRTPDLLWRPAVAGRGTFVRWLDWATGTNARQQLTVATAPSPALRDYRFDIAFWMRPDHGVTTKAEWDAKFKKHVDRLLACMAAVNKTDVPECGGSDGEYHAFLPSPLPGFRLFWSTDGIAWNSSYLGTQPISLGTPLWVRWEADVTQACSIEATFPAGVRSSSGMGTGSNWRLSDGVQNAGVITEPGVYRFDGYCEDETLNTSMVFLAGGAAKRSRVILQAVVTYLAGQPAKSDGPVLVTTDARKNDNVTLSFTSDDVKAGSCTLTQAIDLGAPAVIDTGESGFVPILISGATSQTYIYSCDRDDGLAGKVTATVKLNLLAKGGICDINSDGKIDSTDIAAIQRAAGSRATTADLRDSNFDGMIQIEDARICVLRCTNPLCRP